MPSIASPSPSLHTHFQPLTHTQDGLAEAAVIELLVLKLAPLDVGLVVEGETRRLIALVVEILQDESDNVLFVWWVSGCVSGSGWVVVRGGSTWPS